ncbi:unnamed protein product [Vicia faba]|uniref:Uncharacterized protein n=1 Tax=Vicia faba TaxID=3906 RepID=A0AAV1AHE4_VICFA|nr:unnamed protein product [Vicia faba]
MGRAPCCAKVGLHKGPWTTKEDALLTKYVQAHGEGQWKSLPKKAGLLRCGKSCRLRWMNYLRPDIKRGNITQEEDDLIIRLHSLLGNKWSLIAGRLPGRTDNEIKNYWNTHLLKKLQRNEQTSEHDNEDQQRKTKKNNNVGGNKKKKNNNNKQKKNDKKKGKSKINDDEEEDKIQVYLPKAIRIKALTLPRTDSGSFTFESNSSSESQQKQGNEQVTNNNVVCEVGEIGENDRFGFCSDDHDLVNDIECESFFDTGNNRGTLERLYDEYFQLLNVDGICNFEFDSFAESIFN